jgi:hypothetical protein
MALATRFGKMRSVCRRVGIAGRQNLVRPVTILAGCGNSLRRLLRGTFLGYSVDTLPVIGCIVARLALNLLDDLRVWNLIRIETLVALDASQ